MKSIFRKAIVAIFGAMMVCGFANAQGDVTIILEAHDVWKDGSGYQLLLDKDHNTYGESSTYKVIKIMREKVTPAVRRE